MGVLLWLEIAGLAAVLLLTFTAVNLGERAALFTAWRAAYLARQTQYGFLSALLAFLWASGFAVILLLLALHTGLSVGYSLDLSLMVLARHTHIAAAPAGYGAVLF